MTLKVFSRIALGLGIAALASSAVTLLLIPGGSTLAITKAVIGVAAIAFFFATNRSSLGRAVAGRATYFYATSIVIGVMLAVAVIAANFVATKKQISWDLTKGGIFTLAPDTQKTLRELPGTVNVTAFYASADPNYPGLKDLFDRYVRENPDKLSVEFVDPLANPERVKAKQIKEAGPRILVSHGEVETRITDATEEALTNAILKVLRTSEKKLYFTTGHGEGDLEASDASGYSNLEKQLADEGLEAATASLVTSDVPADAAAIVILGPRKAFLEPEIAALSKYLDGGGRLLVALEPGTSDPGLEKLLEKHGLVYEDAIVVDPLSRLMGGGDAIPVIQNYAEHEITKGFGLVTIFPTARPVLARGDANPRPTVLALTNPSAWAETDLSGTKAVKYDEDEKRGSLGVLAAVSKPSGDKELRIAAFGDAEFANNQYSTAGGNADLFLNSVNWLTSQESRITIRPKTRAASSLVLTEADARFLNFFSIDLLPMLILGMGFAVWLVRRAK